jgi:hypothetical protein
MEVKNIIAKNTKKLVANQFQKNSRHPMNPKKIVDILTAMG